VPTVMLMDWDGTTQDQYDSLMDALALDSDPPTGLVMHMAGPKQGGWRVIDVWESQGSFETFLKERLMAATQGAGLQGQPRIEFFDAYNLYAPGLSVLADDGGSSLPPSRHQTL
jgi:hypothetical protein